MIELDKFEEKVLKKYKTHITKLIKDKYKKKAIKIAKDKRYCYKFNDNKRKNLRELTKEIYLTYKSIIEEEIEFKIQEYFNSKKFKKAVEIEINLSKKKISYKNLKKYQKFNIIIQRDFLKELYNEVNKDKNVVTLDELKYILLSTIYTIIDFILAGNIIKIGTLFKLWLEKRDIRINLPNAKERLMEDRLIPKLKLCSRFDYNLFQEINKDNEPIMNYYKQKMERFLMIVKRIKKNENNKND